MLRGILGLLASLLLIVPPSFGQVAIKSARGAVLDGYYFRGPNCALPQRVQHLTLLHTDSAIDSLAPGTTIDKGMVVARTQPLPAIRSVYHGADLAASEAAYDAGQFPEAARLLREAIAKEPDNPFLLNAYARALYQVQETNPQSYTAYLAVFRLLDAQYKSTPTELAVDCWFLESYWKFGTLCLDQGQWEVAALCIEQCLAGSGDLYASNPLLLEQALGYLTEAFAESHRPALCRYYGQRTLKLFPVNRYVRPYLAALPKPKPAPRR
jgi:tetratricopeptide (TPR) repeat protein